MPQDTTVYATLADLHGKPRGFYFVDKSAADAAALTGQYQVAWEQPGGTRGGPALLLWRIILLVAATVSAVVIMVAIREVLVVLLVDTITIQARDKMDRPTLITDARGNVYTISYDAEGNASIKDHENPNKWLVDLGVVVAVIVVAVVATFLITRFIRPPAPVVPAVAPSLPVAAMSQGGTVLVGEKGPEVVTVTPLLEASGRVKGGEAGERTVRIVTPKEILEAEDFAEGGKT